MQLTVDQRQVSGQPGVLVVAPNGEIDLASAPQLRQGLENAEERVTTGLVIDLRSVTFIDSTGIGELVGCHRRSRDRDLPLAFVVPDGTIRKILNVTGMDSVFDLHDAEAAAVAAVVSESSARSDDAS